MLDHVVRQVRASVLSPRTTRRKRSVLGAIHSALETLEDRRLLSTVYTDIGLNTPDYAAGVAALPSGGLAIAGITYSGSAQELSLALYDANGTLSTKGSTPLPWLDLQLDAVNAATADNAGRILVVGAAYRTGPTAMPSDSGYDLIVARFAPDGQLDLAFGDVTDDNEVNGPGIVTAHFTSSLGFYDSAFGAALAIDDNGKILVAATNQSNNPDDAGFTLLRLTDDGQFDNSFGRSDGIDARLGWTVVPFNSPSDQANAIALQADGKILLAGYTSDALGNPMFALARVDANGDIDPSFDSDGKVSTPIGDAAIARTLAIDPNGNIYAGGLADASLALAQYATDGSLTAVQTANLPAPYLAGQINDLAIAADGTVIAVGAAYNGDSYNNDTAIVKYAAGGPQFTFLSLGQQIGWDPDNETYMLVPGEDSARAIALQIVGNHQILSVAGSADRAYLDAFSSDSDFTLTQIDLGQVSSGSGQTTATLLAPDEPFVVANPYLFSATAESAGGESISFIQNQHRAVGGDTAPGGPIPDATFLWYVNDTPQPGPASSSFSFVPPNSDNYTITAVLASDPTVSAQSTITAVRAALDPDGNLLVGGALASANLITISSSGAGVSVFNNTNQGAFYPTGQIIIRGGNAGNVISLAGSITKTAIIFGGSGTDLIRGGNGNNIIVGGDGADLIVGGNNRDLLIGGKGGDILFGNASDDILVAGFSAYDNNLTALRAILSEWTSSKPFAVRVANLKNLNPAPDRLNGDYFLDDSATVSDDASMDILTGNAGTDWFLFNRDTGVRDWVLDRTAVESQYASDLDQLNI